MSGGPKPGWSEAVADRLLGIGEEAGAERGHMFGHPALYAGRKLAACAYGDGIGLKLPRQRVTELLESGGGTPFQPYGKSRMPEWIHLRVETPSDLDERAGIIAESIAFVASQSVG